MVRADLKAFTAKPSSHRMQRGTTEASPVENVSKSLLHMAAWS
jgi:hypothetical protein